MKRIILVATDFSPAALNAANYAAEMALVMKADILLLHVYQVPVSYSEVAVAVNETDMTENVEKAMNALKEELINKFAGKINVTADIRMGIFSYGLQLACEEAKPTLVVMGSQGTSAVERLIFGSHTVLAVQYLQCPLITVPVGVAFTAIKKIGLACDFDKITDNTPVDEIKMLVGDFAAELHIINSGKREVFNPNAVFGPRLLNKMLAPVEPFYHFIVHENVDEGIMDFSKKNQISLLVVLPKRHHLLDKLVHKSHTKQLVLHSDIPVMAIHP